MVACDLPFLTVSFLRSPRSPGRPGRTRPFHGPPQGAQPLCAVYDQSCRRADPCPTRASVSSVCPALRDAVRVTEIGPSEIAPFDPDGTLFFNVNTLDDYSTRDRPGHPRSWLSRRGTHRTTGTERG